MDTEASATGEAPLDAPAASPTAAAPAPAALRDPLEHLLERRAAGAAAGAAGSAAMPALSPIALEPPRPDPEPEADWDPEALALEAEAAAAAGPPSVDPELDRMDEAGQAADERAVEEELARLTGEARREDCWEVDVTQRCQREWRKLGAPLQHIVLHKLRELVAGREGRAHQTNTAKWLNSGGGLNLMESWMGRRGQGKAFRLLWEEVWAWSETFDCWRDRILLWGPCHKNDIHRTVGHIMKAHRRRAALEREAPPPRPPERPLRSGGVVRPRRLQAGLGRTEKAGEAAARFDPDYTLGLEALSLPRAAPDEPGAPGRTSTRGGLSSRGAAFMIWSRYHAYFSISRGVPLLDSGASHLRIVYITTNSMLLKKVQRDFTALEPEHMLLAPPGEQQQQQQQEAAAAAAAAAEGEGRGRQRRSEAAPLGSGDGDLGDCLADLRDDAYPLFVTARRDAIASGSRSARLFRIKIFRLTGRKWLDLVDGTLERPFFPRGEGGRIAGRPGRWVDDEFFASKLWGDLARAAQRKGGGGGGGGGGGKATQQPPPLPHSQLVWTEFMSLIAGSVESLQTEDGYVDLATYQEMGRNRSRLASDREVQDFTGAELGLVATLASDLGGLFFCGDTCQTVARGLAFRICDLRSVLHHLFGKGAPLRLDHLSLNYRSHDGILACAAVCVDMLLVLFPKEIDELPRDQGLRSGLPPSLLRASSEPSLTTFLFGSAASSNSGGAAPSFGPDQVVIVRSVASARGERLRAQLRRLLSDSIVLTVEEAKGLEFEEVLLFNFFTDGPALDEGPAAAAGPKRGGKEAPLLPEELRQRGSAARARMWQGAVQAGREEVLARASPAAHLDPDPAEASAGRGPSSRSAHFDPYANRLVATELKHLYTSLTRAKTAVWIFDEDEKARKPMFDLLAEARVVESVAEDAAMAMGGVALSRATGTPEQWRRRGLSYMEAGLFGQAELAFRRGGDERLASVARAEVELAAADAVKDERKRKGRLLVAARLFESADEKSRSADCYEAVGDREKARSVGGLPWLEQWAAKLLSKSGCEAAVYGEAAKELELAQLASADFDGSSGSAVGSAEREEMQELKSSLRARAAELFGRAAAVGQKSQAPRKQVHAWATQAVDIWLDLGSRFAHASNSAESFRVFAEVCDTSDGDTSRLLSLRAAARRTRDTGALKRAAELECARMVRAAEAADQRAKEALGRCAWREGEDLAREAVARWAELQRRAPRAHAQHREAADAAVVRLATALCTLAGLSKGKEPRLAASRVTEAVENLAGITARYGPARSLVMRMLGGSLKLGPCGSWAMLHRRRTALAAALASVISGVRTDVDRDADMARACAAVADHITDCLLESVDDRIMSVFYTSMEMWFMAVSGYRSIDIGTRPHVSASMANACHLLSRELVECGFEFLDDALRVARMAADLDPTDDALRWLGNLQRMLETVEHSQASVDMCAVPVPDQTQQLAERACEDGRWDEAERHARSALTGWQALREKAQEPNKSAACTRAAHETSLLLARALVGQQRPEDALLALGESFLRDTAAADLLIAALEAAKQKPPETTETLRQRVAAMWPIVESDCEHLKKLPSDYLHKMYYAAAESLVIHAPRGEIDLREFVISQRVQAIFWRRAADVTIDSTLMEKCGRNAVESWKRSNPHASPTGHVDGAHIYTRLALSLENQFKLTEAMHCIKHALHHGPNDPTATQARARLQKLHPLMVKQARIQLHAFTVAHRTEMGSETPRDLAEKTWKMAVAGDAADVDGADLAIATSDDLHLAGESQIAAATAATTAERWDEVALFARRAIRLFKELDARSACAVYSVAARLAKARFLYSKALSGRGETSAAADELEKARADDPISDFEADFAKDSAGGDGDGDGDSERGDPSLSAQLQRSLEVAGAQLAQPELGKQCAPNDCLKGYEVSAQLASTVYAVFKKYPAARRGPSPGMAAEHAVMAAGFALQDLRPSRALGWARVAVDPEWRGAGAPPQPDAEARRWITLARSLDAVGSIELAAQAAEKARAISQKAARARRGAGAPVDPTALELLSRLRKEVARKEVKLKAACNEGDRDHVEKEDAALAVEAQNEALRLAAETDYARAEQEARRAVECWRRAGLDASVESAKVRRNHGQ
eukprot:tig00020629_g12385.t1